MTNHDSGSALLSALSSALADAVETAAPAVVTVNARRRFPASGIAWPGTPGVIVTSDHVIEREEDITVALGDGTTLKASIAGRDPGSDIAVLRVEGTPAQATLAPGTQRPGELVLAVGRPEEGGVTVSNGVISVVGGPWNTGGGHTVDGYLRSDTTFYPGFSGGPLIDVQGRVVGLNSSRLGRGAGLTIPSHAVSTIATALLSGGRLRRGYLGITTQPVQVPEGMRSRAAQAGESGLMVMSVEPESPAARGGLVLGDIVVAMGGTTIADPGDLQRQLGSGAVGRELRMTVIRGGEPRELAVTVGERP